jgi:hypothetical protein
MTQPMSKEQAVETIASVSESLKMFSNGGLYRSIPGPSARAAYRMAESLDLALSTLRQGEGRRATDAEIAGWLERHDLQAALPGSDARAAFEDAQSLVAHPPAQAATQGEGEAVFSTMADDNGPAIADRHSQPERPQGGDAWDCPLCGQRNSGWSNECGRCEMKRLATPQPAHAVGEAQISTAPAIRAASKFLIDRFGKARCDSEAVSCCVRCNAVALARMSVELLTPPLPVERKEGERG